MSAKKAEEGSLAHSLSPPFHVFAARCLHLTVFRMEMCCEHGLKGLGGLVLWNNIEIIVIIIIKCIYIIFMYYLYIVCLRMPYSEAPLQICFQSCLLQPVWLSSQWANGFPQVKGRESGA